MGSDGWLRLNNDVTQQQAQIEALTELVSDLMMRVIVLEGTDVPPE